MPPTEPRSELSIREAAPADLAEIAELYIAARREAVPQMPPPARREEEIRAWFAARGADRETWVAEDDRIVGFAMLDQDWLESLYVGPDRQGAGVGSALLEVIKARRPAGFGLWVFAQNAAGRGFYHRHGLIELEHTDGSANDERAPDIQMIWPGTEPLRALRARIDQVDDQIAALLARRFALTAAVQGVKATPGRPGRDPAREAQIAERMARHVPGLSVAAVARIMDAVISESLDAFASGAGIAGDELGNPEQQAPAER